MTYYNGSTSVAENESTSTGPGPVSIASAGVTFLAGANSGSTVQIADNQITIVNTLSGIPYCSGNFASTGCTDQISGFDVLFTGESITGVSVDAALTDPSMDPVTGTAPPYSFAHNGLQLLSANEILVDLTGDLPAGTETLTLNVTTASGSIGTPEPWSVALLGVGLLGLLAVRRRALPL
ncbi:MAG: PEP-CTERM sorting domain-containing protein [Acetobacteraceae bacterium]